MKPRSWITLAAICFLATGVRAAPLQVASAGNPSGGSTAPDILNVEVSGHGEPSVIFIAGLGCPSTVWEHVVARFEAANRCHVITLPGFAGQPPVATDHFMDDMADAVIAYVRTRKLGHPVLVGHSFGGVLALKIGLRAPDLPGRLIVVDSFPFLAAIMGPGIENVADARPIAESYHKRLAGETPTEFAAERQRQFAAMTNLPERAVPFADAASKSDQSTIAEAMSEMILTDLRANLGAIKCPTLVMGALGDKKVERGMSREATEATFFQQYAQLPGVRFRFFNFARHFIMVDDIEGFTDALRGELTAK